MNNNFYERNSKIYYSMNKTHKKARE